MDEAVIKYYRKLLREDFPNAGQMENATVFVEAVGEKLINCGNTGNFMQLFLSIAEGRIVEIKYVCACEPVANVAVEVMCSFANGKTLQEAANLREESFYQFLGSRDEKLEMKVKGLLGLLNEGIEKYYTQTGVDKHVHREAEKPESKLTWDGTLST